MPKRYRFFLLLFILLLTFTTIIFASTIYTDRYADPNGNIDIHNTDIPDSKVLFSGNRININQTLNQMAVFTGNDVHLDGEYHGDVFVFAQNCELKGIFHKNVTVFSMTLKDASTVEGSRYAFASTATFSGTTQNDGVFFGDQITLDNNASIGRDAFVFGNTAELSGLIGRNLTAKGVTIAIDGTISGTVDTETTQLSIGKTAQLAGALTNHSPNEATIAQGATLANKPYWDKTVEENTMNSLVRSVLTTLNTTVIVWLVLRFLAPRLYNNAGSYVHKNKFPYVFAMGVGLFILTFFAIIALLLQASFFGVSLSLFYFGLLFYSALLIVAPAIALSMFSYAIGNRIGRHNFLLELGFALLLSVLYGFVISLDVAWWMLINFSLTTFAFGFIGFHVLEQNRAFRNKNITLQK